MSIWSEIDRISAAKTDIESAILSKGVTVPTDTLLDGFGTFIRQIQQGSQTEKKYIFENGVGLHRENFSSTLSGVTNGSNYTSRGNTTTSQYIDLNSNRPSSAYFFAYFGVDMDCSGYDYICYDVEPYAIQTSNTNISYRQNNATNLKDLTSTSWYISDTITNGSLILPRQVCRWYVGNLTTLRTCIYTMNGRGIRIYNIWLER